MTPEEREQWLAAVLSGSPVEQESISKYDWYCCLDILAAQEPHLYTRRERVQIKVRTAKWWVQRIVREKGRRTCGYCGWGWRHRAHCPLTGRIGKPDDVRHTWGWQS